MALNFFFSGRPQNDSFVIQSQRLRVQRRVSLSATIQMKESKKIKRVGNVNIQINRGTRAPTRKIWKSVAIGKKKSISSSWENKVRKKKRIYIWLWAMVIPPSLSLLEKRERGWLGREATATIACQITGRPVRVERTAIKSTPGFPFFF